MTISAPEPLISVIVPVYNAASSLHRSLGSVLRQTLTDFELIVIDDCSTDDSAAVLQRYQTLDDRVRVFSTKSNGGPGVARNIGLRNARGRYIAFLDSDDIWLKHKLERQIESFDNDEVILSYTATVLLTPRGNVTGILNGREKICLRDMKFANRIPLSSAMFRKDLIGAEEMPEIRNREDYAYWISLLKKNQGHSAGVSDALVGYVKTPGSLTSNARRNIVDTYRMYVTEVKLSPVKAAAAVLVLSSLKVQKEVWARASWLCRPKARRSPLQRSVRECWNYGQEITGS